MLKKNVYDKKEKTKNSLLPIVVLGTVFLVSCFFYFYKAGTPELTGDEAASYISLIPFLRFLGEGKLVPSFLTYFHEPIQLLIQTPFVFAGLTEWLVRLPNIISGCLIFIILAKIWQKHFYKNYLSLFFLLCIFTFSGYFFFSRLAMHIGVFGLLISIFTYYVYEFLSDDNNHRIKSALILLFLAIFVFIDAIFLAPGILIALWSKKRQVLILHGKTFVVFVLITGMVFLIWFGVSIFGSLTSGSYNWQNVAPARLFSRGTTLGHLSIKENYETFTIFSDPIFVISLAVLLIISLWNRKSAIAWKMLLVPLVFFNIIKAPTLHLVFFYPIIILLAASGWALIWEKIHFLGRTILIICSVIILVINVKSILMHFSQLHDHGYKQAGSFIAKTTNICEPILTNIDGYIFRLYFGRRYIGSYDGNAKFAVVESNRELDSKLGKLGFRLLARTALNSPIIDIYQKGYSGKTKELKDFDKQNYTFEKLMPYAFNCSKLN